MKGSDGVELRWKDKFEHMDLIHVKPVVRTPVWRTESHSTTELLLRWMMALLASVEAESFAAETKVEVEPPSVEFEHITKTKLALALATRI